MLLMGLSAQEGLGIRRVVVLPARTHNGSMGRRWLLAAATAFLAASCDAAVIVSIRLPEVSAPETARKLELTEPVLQRLLADGAMPAQGPFAGPDARYTRLSPAGLRTGLPEEEREALRAALLGLWGEGLSLEEVPATAPERRPAVDRKAEAKRVAARLDVGLSAERQNLFYDGAHSGPASAGPVVTAASPRHEATSLPPSIRPAAARTSAPPSPQRSADAEGVRWGRVGVEVLKGAGETVRSIFTWKGLATAAAAVAIVTVAPVAVYGFLAVGVAVGGYTVGKALYDGYQANRKGDAEGVYAASREFGKGALTLGLSFYGARHTPASLKPHIPKVGEFRALLSSMDDEAVVATTLVEKFRGK